MQFSIYLQAGPYDNLKDITLKILENNVATVPIIHSVSEDGSFPQLLHMASLSGILRCKQYHFSKYINLYIVMFFYHTLSDQDLPLSFRHLQVF